MQILNDLKLKGFIELSYKKTNNENINMKIGTFNVNDQKISMNDDKLEVDGFLIGTNSYFSNHGIRTQGTIYSDSISINKGLQAKNLYVTDSISFGTHSIRVSQHTITAQYMGGNPVFTVLKVEANPKNELSQIITLRSDILESSEVILKSYDKTYARFDKTNQIFEIDNQLTKKELKLESNSCINMKDTPSSKLKLFRMDQINSENLTFININLAAYTENGVRWGDHFSAGYLKIFPICKGVACLVFSVTKKNTSKKINLQMSINGIIPKTVFNMINGSSTLTFSENNNKGNISLNLLNNSYTESFSFIFDYK